MLATLLDADLSQRLSLQGPKSDLEEVAPGALDEPLPFLGAQSPC